MTVAIYGGNVFVQYQDGYKNKEYKLPKIGVKTDKGKWLNAFAKTILTGTHNYNFVGKLHVKLKTTQFKMNKDLSVIVAWFKKLKKLIQDKLVGEVFNSQLVCQPTREAS